MKYAYHIAIFCALAFSCRKKTIPLPPQPLGFVQADVNNKPQAVVYYDIGISPVLKLIFNNTIDRQSVVPNISLNENVAGPVPVNFSYEKNDSVVVVIPQ